jgi:hypothetical protein
MKFNNIIASERQSGVKSGMINRRSFLKSIGLGAAAIGTGFGTGKLLTGSSSKRFALHGFLPANEKVISDLLSAFNRKANSSSVTVFADNKLKSLIENHSGFNGSSSKGNVVVRAIKLDKPVMSDILLSDSEIAVYDPEADFNVAFDRVRSAIKNKRAEYYISVEYKEEGMLSILKSSEKKLVIENSKGIVDVVKFNNSYNNIVVDGVLGKTGISLSGNSVHVHTSACKHQLCKLSGYASAPGDVIACAPNKVILRIETV